MSLAKIKRIAEWLNIGDKQTNNNNNNYNLLSSDFASDSELRILHVFL